MLFSLNILKSKLPEFVIHVYFSIFNRVYITISLFKLCYHRGTTGMLFIGAVIKSHQPVEQNLIIAPTRIGLN